MRVFLMICIALLVLPQAFAATYYVRTDGNDACTGLSNTAGSSGSCAFRTIGRANTIAACGDTIQIGAGIFEERTKVTISNACTGSSKKIFRGAGTGQTFWMAGLADVNEAACTADSNPGVYRCPVPSGFASDAAGNYHYCFVQRNTNHVRFLDDNGVSGDMEGPVCLTWNTAGPGDLSGKEGGVFYDGGSNFYITPWDGLSPGQADFWVPSRTGYASGADGPVMITGNFITLQDVTIVGAAYTNLAVSGDDVSVERVHVYTGMSWFNPQTQRALLRDSKFMNAYRRPANGFAPTSWGRTNSQTLSMQGSHFTIENLESYAAREGIGFTDGASFGTINGLKAHGHHNHILKIQDGAHDITVRDCITYNGQEPVFIECAYNLEFSHCTFPFSSIVFQANPLKTCTPPTSNVDFFNNVWCGVHYFDLYGNTWAAGGHDLDYNVYMSDHANCYQNAWLVGADSIKFETLSEWRNWNGAPARHARATPTQQRIRLQTPG
ncbi:MAG: hypothetical protein HC945_01975 [Nitrosarchaeum sp.]|nr:hypothetical protein [Nitrosarchaeum sp.]